MGSIILRGGTIVDGTGSSRYPGDVWIDGDKIREIGNVKTGIAGEEIDVSGLVVAPGFIDIHTHTDRKIFDNPMGDSKVMQGVTTDVTSNCGIGPFPACERRFADLESYLGTLSGSLPAGGVTWTDFNGFAAAVEKVEPGMNLAMLAAQGAVQYSQPSAGTTGRRHRRKWCKCRNCSMSRCSRGPGECQPGWYIRPAVLPSRMN